MSSFNQTCPAPGLLPKLEASYRHCVTHERGACEQFVSVLKQLLPEYDCQRPFDATPQRNYIVPAIWLAGDLALDRYFELLAKLKMKSARKLFASPEFRSVLDGEFAESYLERSLAAERQMKTK